jgi:hypothetical protein
MVELRISVVWYDDSIYNIDRVVSRPTLDQGDQKLALIFGHSRYLGTLIPHMCLEYCGTVLPRYKSPSDESLECIILPITFSPDLGSLLVN